jgi:hypothetical protein
MHTSTTFDWLADYPLPNGQVARLAPAGALAALVWTLPFDQAILRRFLSAVLLAIDYSGLRTAYEFAACRLERLGIPSDRAWEDSVAFWAMARQELCTLLFSYRRLEGGAVVLSPAHIWLAVFVAQTYQASLQSGLKACGGTPLWSLASLDADAEVVLEHLSPIADEIAQSYDPLLSVDYGAASAL